MYPSAMGGITQLRCVEQGVNKQSYLS